MAPSDADGGNTATTDTPDAAADAHAKPGAATCETLCARATECLAELGPKGSASGCLDWCTKKIAAENLAKCAACFAATQCSAIFHDPLYPWLTTHLNPGDCIKDCGLGTCERDSECDPSLYCAPKGDDRVECLAR